MEPVKKYGEKLEANDSFCTYTECYYNSSVRPMNRVDPHLTQDVNRKTLTSVTSHKGNKFISFVTSLFVG
jgi:hypothetical protein